MNGNDVQRVTGVLMAGVGGQGIILASDLLTEAALASGLDVKKSEVHGMAQRGGSVISHVRFGPRVWSPLIPEGEADFLVAFEEMEALRYLHLLRRGGTLIINRRRIKTLAMLQGREAYPEKELAALAGLPLQLVALDGPELARAAGNPRTENVAVLGALAAQLPFESATWREVLARRVPPKHLESNRAAFDGGMSFALSRRGTRREKT